MDPNVIQRKEIKFFVQNTEHVVKVEELSPQTTLNTYLRDVLHLKGTKKMCLIGGCGSCIVVAERQSQITKKPVFFAVNSCLVSIFSCHGWRIYTVEGIGTPSTGYHVVQEVLAKFNGTQCGFCSPGMVMNMYALYQSGNLTMKEVENSFAGNLCRCTGYRPILAAFKSLCKDAGPELRDFDIEDFKPCQKTQCTNQCSAVCDKQPFYHVVGKSKWVKVFALKDLLSTLKTLQKSKYFLVSGNTAKGVSDTYKALFDVYIDINDVPELKFSEMRGANLVVGANTSLATTMEIFNKTAQENTKFSYLKQLVNHLDLIANVPVRNLGSLAGNLMIKHDNNEFPSDLFLVLETVAASITIVDANSGQETTVSPANFLKYGMTSKVVHYISLPGLDESLKFESYKIMARAQNTHALVNAGFLFGFGSEKALKSVNLVFGNINSEFVHASEAEKFLLGKNLFDNQVLQSAYGILSKEINPDMGPPEPSPDFRRQLAISLFYKAVLSLAADDKLSPRNKSGGAKLERTLSTSVVDYETNKALYPLTQPIPKIEALAQTSGQAEYIDDMPDLPNQLFAAFVLANAAPNSIIKNIDPSKALKLEKIVAFFGKSDIPGSNNFTPPQIFSETEEIFCSGKVLFYHQPIGLVVGKEFEAVQKAADLVEVTYEDPKESPLLTVREILKRGKVERLKEVMTVTPKRKGGDIKHVIKGSLDIYHQYHLHMETQCCNVIPTEDGLDVFPSTQWMDLIQIAIANMLKMSNNKINVKVRRCGGAFGAKISRNSLISCAAALAAWKLQKPVKLSMPLTTNMNVVGKRWPLSNDYEVGVNNKGVIQYLNSTLYSDLGAASNENGFHELQQLFMANYDPDTFLLHFKSAKTDTHANTWTRAPGSTEGLCAIEAIMDHIAYSIDIDPLDARIANITKEANLLKYIKDLLEWASIDQRKKEIVLFNKENRWKKKGISVVPMAYNFTPYGPFSAMVSIFHGDGSVAISHGGVEIGQGINTKAAQVCAYKLGIPLEKVAVMPSKSSTSPNAAASGGSVTSEAICYGVIKACDELIAKMKPVKDKMQNPTWEELIKKCYEEQITLATIGGYSSKLPDVSSYIIYGVCATEVVVDILTGQHLVTRVDFIEDTGQSMSPEIDIGQIEGAFVMGMGYYTIEQIVFDKQGKILTNSTWNYLPPGAKDIPIDFRVKFPKNNPNPVGVLKSKAVAEPPLCMSVAVPLAIRNAVASARTDSNPANPKWFPFDGPTTVENVFMNSTNDYEQYFL